MKVTQVTAPTVEPVTSSEARIHLRLSPSEYDNPGAYNENTYVTSLIKAGREYAEGFTNRVFITQTWDMWLNDWPNSDFIEIPKPPLQSVTSITYTINHGRLLLCTLIIRLRSDLYADIVRQLTAHLTIVLMYRSLLSRLFI